MILLAVVVACAWLAVVVVGLAMCAMAGRADREDEARARSVRDEVHGSRHARFTP